MSSSIAFRALMVLRKCLHQQIRSVIHPGRFTASLKFTDVWRSNGYGVTQMLAKEVGDWEKKATIDFGPLPPKEVDPLEKMKEEYKKLKRKPNKNDTEIKKMGILKYKITAAEKKKKAVNK